ncbi:YetF domain-containing protein [Methylocystis parvus]
MRREGCASLSRVRFAILENDGTISVGLNTKRAASAARKGQEE